MRKKALPQGWVGIKLGEYLKELSERHNSSSNSNIPVLSVTNRPGFTVSEEFFNRKVFSKDLSNYKVVRKGQFAYNPSRVNVGSIARLKEFDKGLLSPMYVVFEAKEGMDGSYLDYWISSQRFRNLVRASTQGSVRDSLNFSALAEFPFNLPPEVEQKEIISILACVDSVIDKTQAIIDQTQTLKKGLMQELFTHGIPGRHKRFKNTEIGEIPGEWDMMSIRDSALEIIDGDRGKNYPKQDDFMEEGYCLFLSATNVTKTGFNFQKTQFISKEKDSCLGTGKVLRGDIIVTSRGTVGNMALYEEKVPYENIRINSGMFILRNNDRGLATEYIFHAFKNRFFIEGYSTLASGSAQPQLPIKDFIRFLFTKPSLDEQKEIVGIAALLESRLEANSHFLNGIIDVKHALLQALLSGEVRVKV